MKKTLLTILILLLIGAGVYIYLIKNGYSDKSIFSKPLYYDLSVTCSDVNNLLVTSEIDVTVASSERTHNNVTVLITAYGAGGEIVKQKRTTFERTLEGNQSLTKPVTLPAKTRSCSCVIESSNPL